ncbi:hypothetical protein DEU56DRAFT_271782 [Suillus clintonianus]|uniref:uncharacterized protein n=1 Tax=Suillus clintonianus TaxID=1904413 RepID=UPI001B85D7FF|nr:uncharacterized protein DEU56DRAFT_271782 [Suillus clintonianus]KAG2141946.1 hypothetical protein DEU56DRAFT_271782 [Suillus clintonianus]
MKLMNTTLPEVREPCQHPNRVDALLLPFVKFMTPTRSGGPVRFEAGGLQNSTFDFEILQMDKETAAYRAIIGCGVGPAFLGHIIEGDRVIGFLVEQLHRRSAGPEDLQGCRDAMLQARHHPWGPEQTQHCCDLGRNRHNDRFENVMPCKSAEQKSKELATLPAQLSETAGRGGVASRQLVY